jgi:hypothetical protein
LDTSRLSRTLPRPVKTSKSKKTTGKYQLHFASQLHLYAQICT